MRNRFHLLGCKVSGRGMQFIDQHELLAARCCACAACPLSATLPHCYHATLPHCYHATLPHCYHATLPHWYHAVWQSIYLDELYLDDGTVFGRWNCIWMNCIWMNCIWMNCIWMNCIFSQLLVRVDFPKSKISERKCTRDIFIKIFKLIFKIFCGRAAW